MAFQSTRPRGARPITADKGFVVFSFNPRAREGRDKDSRKTLLHFSVSIHAPARGATTFLTRRGCCVKSFNPRAREGRDNPRSAFRRGLRGFNPRAREGRDGNSEDRVFVDFQFQSTRPRGARPGGTARSHCFPMFQSTRPRGARRAGMAEGGVFIRVSIHAPARGATCARALSWAIFRDVSIHAPARGATN